MVCATSSEREISSCTLAIHVRSLEVFVLRFTALMTTETRKSEAAIGKKREVRPSVASTTERDNHARSGETESTPRLDEVARKIDDRQISSTKKDVSTHAAKRKKLSRNEKLIGSDGFDEIDQKPTSTTDSVATDRKSDMLECSEIASIFDRVRSATPAEKPPDYSDAVNATNKTDHVTSEVQYRHVDADLPSLTATGSSSVAEKASGKDRADILDDVEDEVADSFALFAPIKSTSGVGTAAEEELPVAQTQQPGSRTTSRTNSYDRLSSGGAAIAMADSGYQTYDHDLAAQMVPDLPSSAKPEVTSELEVQSSISEPDIADAVARYSASSDSEISVELPSYASSSGADKPTSFDWQLPPPDTQTTQDETSQDDDGRRGKVARRASEEDLDEIRSAMLLHFNDRSELILF